MCPSNIKSFPESTSSDTFNHAGSCVLIAACSGCPGTASISYLTAGDRFCCPGGVCRTPRDHYICIVEESDDCLVNLCSWKVERDSVGCL